jgi:hypothetical protein
LYFAVTRLTLLRPTSAFIDPRIFLDDWIPHLAWTWPAYWLPYFMVPAAVIGSTTRLPESSFRRLIAGWSAMIVIGGVIQVAWPAVAPWPQEPALTQRIYHDSPLILPYATLPSMHVAHVSMAALVAGTVFPSSLVRGIGLVLVLFSVGATLTLEEHFFLDAMAGLALALATWSWWRQ